MSSLSVSDHGGVSIGGANDAVQGGPAAEVIFLSNTGQHYYFQSVCAQWIHLTWEYWTILPLQWEGTGGLVCPTLLSVTGHSSYANTLLLSLNLTGMQALFYLNKRNKAKVHFFFLIDNLFGWEL